MRNESTYINSLDDLSRYVSEQLESYESGLYGMTHADLEAQTLENLRIELRNRGFRWGDRMPEISDDCFDKCVEG